MHLKFVTSLAEVWIEMPKGTVNWKKHTVTSLAEVWIEMVIDTDLELGDIGHFPCGSVD